MKIAVGAESSRPKTIRVILIGGCSTRLVLDYRNIEDQILTSLPVIADAGSPRRRLPPWLKRPMPAAGMAVTRRVVGESGVATVCEEARCPNITECWSQKT